jgi:hypothetical protein
VGTKILIPAAPSEKAPHQWRERTDPAPVLVLVQPLENETTNWETLPLAIPQLFLL